MMLISNSPDSEDYEIYYRVSYNAVELNVENQLMEFKNSKRRL
mgnify:FL=1